MQVITLSSSDFTIVCPRLKHISVATDIPVAEVCEEQLWRITKFVEARDDADLTLSSLDADSDLIAAPISNQAQVDYTEAWDSLFEEILFSVRF